MSLEKKLAENLPTQTINREMLEKLGQYLDLLEKWNRAYNLTAIRDRRVMEDRHILDSLTLVPHLQGDRCADVGTGAGLPGIPLAIVFPEKHFCLIDSNGKKTRFLFQVKTALALTNIEIIEQRVEKVHDRVFDAVISRAFASLQDFVRLAGHLSGQHGKLYAMKSGALENELAELPAGFTLENNILLTVPGNESRCLAIIKRNNHQDKRS